MANVTFITGNQGKADFMAKHLGVPVPHKKIDLDEIQSLDLRKISEHKARQAYEITKSPVLVEDVGLVCEALGELPGPLIKWFLQTLGEAGICNLIGNYENKKAVGKVCFCYFAGKDPIFFEGQVKGRIADEPRGSGGYGWDFIFIPDGADKTYSEMDDDELKRFGLRTTTVYPQIKRFLAELG